MSCFSIKKLYLLLEGSRKNSFFEEFQERLVDLFPCLDIASDIYLISDNIMEDFHDMNTILGQVALFLRRHSFYRINIHPVHTLPPKDLLEGIYNNFFRSIGPFNREGYLHQSASRIMVLPVLIVEGKDDLKRLDGYLNFLRDRLMIPSIYIPEKDTTSAIKGMVSSDQERIYLGLSKGGEFERVVNTLGMHSMFDGLMAWTNAPVQGPLPGCRSLVLSKRDGKIYNCFRRVSSNRPVSDLYSVDDIADFLETVEAAGKKPGDCLTCCVESLTLMKDTLEINEREKDAGGIFLSLGMEMVKEGDYKTALELFGQALELESGFEDTGSILLSKALCHIRQNEMEEAMAALDEAEKQTPSSAMIYYYRGLCEFGLKDYIEAIDRFHDALKLEYDQLPLGDIYFYMGLSHINIEEYSDGLTMMSHAEEFVLDKAPVYYYKGICHLGMQNLEAALDYLKNALASQPQEEDLGSIYFHLGLCYKEMERYEDAITELIRAGKVEEGRKDVHNLTGYCHFKRKEYDNAIQCFLRAIEIDPGSAIDYANIGVNLKEKGEVEKAIPMFKKALSLDPTIGFAVKHLNEINE